MMLATIAKAVLHLVVLVICSLVLLWLLFFFHATGLNSLILPDQLRWHTGAQGPYIGLWYILSGTISYVEWAGLLWLVNKFNYWYGPEWLEPTQIRFATSATVLVGFITAICVAAYYVTLFDAP